LKARFSVARRRIRYKNVDVCHILAAGSTDDISQIAARLFMQRSNVVRLAPFVRFMRMLVAALTVAVGARAEGDPAQPMRLVYQAPPGCPDADAFSAEVRARAPRSSSLGARAVRLRIASRASQTSSFEGSVVITDDSGMTPSRAVRGDTCAEVVRALALTVAMTLDPEESAPPVAELIASPAPPSAERTPPPRTASADGVQVAAGLRGGAETAVGPLVAPSLGIYGDLARRDLSVRLSAVHAISPVVERGAGSARFRRTTAGVDACPLRWRPSASLSLVPCASFEIGSLTSEGRSTVNPESASRLWASAGVAGRVGWEIVGPLVVELEGRAAFPLTRDRFFFRPAEDVFETPIVAFSAGISGAVRFW
jgi:hypothetical protein